MKKILLLLLVGFSTILMAEILKNDTFNRHLCGWNTPNYWAGKTTLITENNKKYFQLEATSKNNDIYGRALGYSKASSYFPSETVKVTIKAKGEGKLVSGVLTYRHGSGQPSYCKDGHRNLTNQFQVYTFNCKLTERFKMILPFIEVRGPGKVIVESFILEKIVNKKDFIKPIKNIQVATRKNPLKEVVFNTTFKNQEIDVVVKNNNKVIAQKVKSNSQGKISVNTQKLTLGLNEISASKDGAYGVAYVDVQNEKDFAITNNIAKKIKLKKQVKYLFLGDSLTDFYRNYNYVDRIYFWLNKYNPNKYSFTNVGVGGDFCKRMLDRLNGELTNKNRAYRQNMYKGLFKNQYDIIFLFLGQNDTRSYRKTNFTKQETPPTLQQTCLKDIYHILKTKFPKAKIVLLSPSPSDEKLFLDRASKLAKGKNMVMYGKKELVDLYDAENRKFCKENKLDYIDVLSVMRKAPSIKALYVNDGIHLSPLGGQVIADEILKYLAK
jgi:lysophospholipase L1-like esterase